MQVIEKSRRTLIVAKAMKLFWELGYSATSMSVLAQQQDVSRKGIYSLFDSKDELFVACLEKYNDEVVTPAFSQVEEKGASFIDVRRYFETQIAMAEKIGFPGVGCLIANTMTEIAPHNQQVLKKITSHHNRLEAGYLNALKGELNDSFNSTSTVKLADIAGFMACTTQGLWSYSRIISSASDLRSKVDIFIESIEARLGL